MAVSAKLVLVVMASDVTTSMNAPTVATVATKMQTVRTQSEVTFVAARADTEMHLVMELCVVTRTSAGQVFEQTQPTVTYRRERFVSIQMVRTAVIAKLDL